MLKNAKKLDFEMSYLRYPLQFLLNRTINESSECRRDQRLRHVGNLDQRTSIKSLRIELLITISIVKKLLADSMTKVPKLLLLTDKNYF